MPGWANQSDEALLVAAAQDADAFSAFYRRYETPILAFFLRRVGDPELAADLTSEVFAAVLSSCARFRPGGAPASAWLFGIAGHKLARSRRRCRVEDRARRQLRMAPIEVSEEDLERVDRLAGPGVSAMELLATLPTEQRDAVQARIVDDRSYQDIASELRCSGAVIRERVSRGLARLREQLREEGA
jgi:RNA polymerase sigma-70 factor (ECF subfamily)